MPSQYIFSKKLCLENVNNILLKNGGKRFHRFLSVLKIIRKCNGENIFLLTYDPIFIIFLQFFKKNIYVYEHNTTPEDVHSKKAVWQKIFYVRIIRFTQYPGQLSILKSLNQKSYHIGSPLIYNRRSKFDLKKRDTILIPSFRLSTNEITSILPFLRKERILLKKIEGVKHSFLKGYNLELRDYIDLKKNISRIFGVLITNKSKIRGTGWFNEAIGYGIPIIITNENARHLFEATFPKYPYIFIKLVTSRKNFFTQISDIGNFSNEVYIKKYNFNFKKLLSSKINF